MTTMETEMAPPAARAPLSEAARLLLDEVREQAALERRNRIAAREIAKEAKKPRTDRDLIVWGRDLAHVDPPVPWICEGLRIAPGRPAVMVGEGGTAKSMIAQHLAISVARGTKFLRRWGVIRGPVLWIDYEQGLALTKRRLQRFARAEGWRLEDHDRDIAYLYKPFFLDAMTKAKRLAELVAGFALVVVDSTRRSAPTLKENEAEASIPFDVMAAVSERSGTSFLAIDHASTKRDKDAGRKSAQRGHSTKLDGCGTLYSLTKKTKDGPTLVTCEREQITGEFMDDWCFEVRDVADPSVPEGVVPTKEQRKWGLQIVEKAAEAAEEHQKPKPPEETTLQLEQKLDQVAVRLLEIVKKNPGISTKELEELAPTLRGATFDGAKNRLIRTGRIVNRTGKSTRTEWVAQ